MPFTLEKVPSPLIDFQNATLTFSVASTTDTVDSSGNPVPTMVDKVIRVYLKPSKNESQGLKEIEQYGGTDVSSVILEGYVTEGDLNGIGIGAATRHRIASDPVDFTGARYREQSGTFIRLIALQSSVQADNITGYPIRGIFQIRGGE
jgi:hypothetical protein